MRSNLAFVLGAKPEDVRVLTGHVGGSFGMKSSVFPEYVAVLHAARVLGRPVKWTDTRSESFAADHHGRDTPCMPNSPSTARAASWPCASPGSATWVHT